MAVPYETIMVVRWSHMVLKMVVIWSHMVLRWSHMVLTMVVRWSHFILTLTLGMFCTPDPPRGCFREFIVKKELLTMPGFEPLTLTL